MKRNFLTFIFCIGLLASSSLSRANSWQLIPNNQVASQGKSIIKPQDFTSYYLNTASLKSQLLTAGYDWANAVIVELPTPDGQYQAFKIWQTPILVAPMTEKFVAIKTFTGTALYNKGVTIKVDFTYSGFHAMVLDQSNTYFIDPYSNLDDGFYTCYYKRNLLKPEGKNMICELGNNETELGNFDWLSNESSLPQLAFKTNGTSKKEYRLALACTIEYAQAVGGSTPTKASVLSAMVTTMNRVNGIYESELSVTMTLIGNTDTLIYLSGTDPYSNTNGGAMLGQNQTNIDNLIGSANYDIGHVFSTGGGGVANLGCVCDNSDKARGVTGSSMPIGDPFDVDYVAHEMGHQFGSDHTFNANSGSCSGNGEQTLAYEPGGGTTIMAYAGICGTTDNIQNNSDAYFHGASLSKIASYITTGDGGSCPITTPMANNIPIVDTFTASYSIPFLPAFELTAPNVSDTDHDVLNYCWEQWNRGNFRSSWNLPNLKGPIYRSFYPDTSATRTFITLPKLLSNISSYKGEKLPEDTRFLTFKLTVRDRVNGLGTFNQPDDTVHIDVINTTTPFAVTAPNTAVSWKGLQTEVITWDVSGTDLAPINTTHVNILLSTDGGLTFPIVLAAGTPNDGVDTITLPNNINTTQARIKIKAVGNVYFDINDADFTITPTNTPVNHISNTHSLQAFPIPAHDELTISFNNPLNSPFEAVIVTSYGQKVWQETLFKEKIITISQWAKGVYFLKLTNKQENTYAVQKIIVE